MSRLSFGCSSRLFQDVATCLRTLLLAPYEVKYFEIRLALQSLSCAEGAPVRPPPELMGFAKKVSFPWQAISIDLMGPLPRSTSGHSYILVVADWFTKYVSVLPLRQATVCKIVSMIENEIFLLFGVPQMVLVDNGTQFKSKQFQDLMTKYSVPKLWYNAKYHPQVNFVERTNRVVKTAIRSFVNQNHRH